MFKRMLGKDRRGIEADAEPISRRGVLGSLGKGVAAGVGMAAGGSLLEAGRAYGGTDGDVVLGTDNSTTGTTRIVNNSSGLVFPVMELDTGDGDGLVVKNNSQDSSIAALNGGVGLALFGHANVGEALYAKSGGTDGTNPGRTRSGVHAVTDSAHDSGVWGEAVAGGAGVTGSTSGKNGGVQGLNLAGGPGLYGTSASGEGLYGQSGTVASAFAGTSLTGVHGVTDSATDSAVWGEAVGGGAGVTGTTSDRANGGVQGVNQGTGPGVLAQNTGGGAALQVSGPAAFSRSGAVSIPAGKSSAKVTGLALGTASLVLATIQGNVAGVYVQGVTVVAGASGSFTVHLNKATPSALPVAWFVLN
jgi:hypothetical protein